jgi:hypothetical protein
LKSCREFDYFSLTQNTQDTELLTYKPKRKQTKFPSPLAVTRPVVDNTASLDNSKKTTLSSKSTKPRPVATPSATKDDPKDKNFAPLKNPRPRSESLIEDIPLNKYGNEIVEDLPPVRYFAMIVKLG